MKNLKNQSNLNKIKIKPKKHPMIIKLKVVKISKFKNKIKNFQFNKTDNLKIHKNKMEINKKLKIFKIKRKQFKRRNLRYGMIYHLILMMRDRQVKMNKHQKLHQFILKNQKKTYFLNNNKKLLKPFKNYKKCNLNALKSYQILKSTRLNKYSKNFYKKNL